MMRCTCSMFWTEGSSQFFCFHLSRCPHHPVMWWALQGLTGSPARDVTGRLSQLQISIIVASGS
ncbi:unnamed protein product [Prunus armeniaca]